MAFLNSVRCLKRAHSSVQTCTRAISTSWATPMPGAACSQLPMLASTAQPPVSWLNDFGFPPAGLPRVGDMPLDDAPFIGDLTPSAGINREIGDVLDSGELQRSICGRHGHWFWLSFFVHAHD